MRNSGRPEVSPFRRWVTLSSMRKTYSSGVHSTEKTWYCSAQSSPSSSALGSQPPTVCFLPSLSRK